MKRILLAAVSLLLYMHATSQNATPTLVNGSGSFTRLMGLQPDAIDGIHRVGNSKFTNSKRVEGSAFFHDDYHPGYIVFPNDQVIRAIPLKFNNLNNELYYQDDSKELVLQTPFKEFGFTVKLDEASKAYTFRTGYPAVDDNDNKTIYQVLAGNRVVLLKETSKKVHEAKELNGIDFLRIRATDNYFAFDSTSNAMVKLGNSVKEITDVLPPRKEQVEKICSAQRLRCRSEKEMVLLFSQMD
jgi:hypothetical protein